jgi:hypothetical protein
MFFTQVALFLEWWAVPTLQFSRTLAIGNLGSLSPLSLPTARLDPHQYPGLHPSSLILHPSSFILHPSSLILYPLSFFTRWRQRASNANAGSFKHFGVGVALAVVVVHAVQQPHSFPQLVFGGQK